MERLSGIDASFLYMETENVHLQIAFVMVCDGTELEGGCSYPHIVELLRAKTLNDSAFRRRLIRVPFDLSHPVWIDDPDYDIQRHVHLTQWWSIKAQTAWTLMSMIYTAASQAKWAPA